ncbi:MULTISPECIES: hypothetical protein [Burkholderia]|uniref:hypothetical protein n=1 Tax=Burkholderia TaxID=32008 RepID=UPI00126A53A3|nr:MULTISPECIES: hypothetical protein [Burkholderia]
MDETADVRAGGARLRRVFPMRDGRCVELRDQAAAHDAGAGDQRMAIHYFSRDGACFSGFASLLRDARVKQSRDMSTHADVPGPIAFPGDFRYRLIRAAD